MTSRWVVDHQQLTAGAVRRIGRFGIVGLAATAIHLAVAQAALLFAGLSPFAANVAGFLVAFLAGFAGHQWFTFRSATPLRQAFRRYGAIALTGFAVNNIILAGLVATGFVSEALALAFAILIVPAGTFLASRFWGFKT